MLALAMVAAVLGAAPVQIAAPGFSAHGFDQSTGNYYNDQVAQQLTLRGLKVITRSEVEALLGNERQKQLLGCTDSGTSCTAELAGALGADGLLLGDIAKVGDAYRLSVRIVRASNGDRLSSAVVTGTNEGAVLDAFSAVSQRIADETNARFRGEGVPAAALQASTQHVGARRFFWAPLAVGVVGIAAGGLGYGQAKSRYDRLRSGETLQEPTPSQLRNEGQTWQLVSAVGFGVGAAAIAASIALVLFGSDSTIETGVAFGPSGFSGSIAGRF